MPKSKTLAHPVLIGDYSPLSLAQRLTKQDNALYKLFQQPKGEGWIENLYAHNLKQGAGLLRAATKEASRSWLQLNGLEESIETFYNVCISKARAAIEKSRSDALLVGVLGDLPARARLSPSQKKSEWAESLIFMADFGVEAIFLEGFLNYTQLEMAMEQVCRVTRLPLAPFLSSDANLEERTQYEQFLIANRVELAGFSGSLVEFKDQNFSPDMALGWMVTAENAGDLMACFDSSWGFNLWAVLPDEKFPYEKWQRLQRELIVRNQHLKTLREI